MLRELQAAFRRALLEGDATQIIALIEPDGLAPEARFSIYHNNVFASLGDALKKTFPTVCRLVDERFFAYAASEFVRAHPPQGARLAEYGSEFPDFLARFAPCRALTYLPDVARLEWLMNVAAQAAGAEPLGPLAIAHVDPQDTPRLTFRLQPVLGFLASPWPIDRIWRSNQAAASVQENINLDAGGVCLEVNRQSTDVVFRLLDQATFCFRRALQRGEHLEAAAEFAIAKDAAFDLTQALGNLFRDGAVIAFALASPPDRPIET